MSKKAEINFESNSKNYQLKEVQKTRKENFIQKHIKTKIIDICSKNRNIPRISLAQRIFKFLVLTPNYTLNSVDIQIKGLEKIPNDEGVIFVMNHTDRYNYWPFQAMLESLNKKTGTIASWVKTKYYISSTNVPTTSHIGKRLVSSFLDKCANIPVASKKHIMEEDYESHTGGKLTYENYEVLKNIINKQKLPENLLNISSDQIPETMAQYTSEETQKLNQQYQEITDYIYSSSSSFHDFESYSNYIKETFTFCMGKTLETSQQALNKGSHLLIFPTGTRSKRLIDGKIGAAQIALYTKATIIPIGCNGSDYHYPGNSPLAKKHKNPIIYRIGDPIKYNDLKEFKINENWEPFNQEDEEKHQEKFKNLSNFLINKIDNLVDPEYKIKK